MYKAKAHQGRSWRSRWRSQNTARWGWGPSGSYRWTRHLKPRCCRWRWGCWDLHKKEKMLTLSLLLRSCSLCRGRQVWSTSNLCCRRWWEPGCCSSECWQAGCWNVRSPQGKTLPPGPRSSRHHPSCWSASNCSNQTESSNNRTETLNLICISAQRPRFVPPRLFSFMNCNFLQRFSSSTKNKNKNLKN